MKKDNWQKILAKGLQDKIFGVEMMRNGVVSVISDTMRKNSSITIELRDYQDKIGACFTQWLLSGSREIVEAEVLR